MKQQRQEYFFDCHCHTMTLGQVNITSFLENLLKNSDLELLFGLLGTTAKSTDRGVSKQVKHVFNLLTLMQNDLPGLFKAMEDDLKGEYGGNSLVSTGGLNMNGRNYSKLVLTPLLMDFKPLPGTGSSTHFPQPDKEIRTLVNEYSFGIKQYYKERPDGLLYILPFLGINPAAHSLKEMESIIKESFDFYSAKLITRSVRGTKLLTWMAGHISPEKMFAGIKLYPPMGFDPWPEDSVEREKVEFLYYYAQKSSIPITTHCNDGGFITVDYKKAYRNTNPLTWEEVLKRFPRLKLNFAHAGVTTTLQFPNLFGRKEKSWTEHIFDLMDQYENVYTDFSFNGISPKFYEKFSQQLSKLDEAGRTRYKERILFGTDFMINLLGIDSYRDYYNIYNEAKLSLELKHRFSSINPRSFLNL